MAYATPNATYGAKDTKKVAKQTKSPPVTTPNATYGATDTKRVARQTSAPSSSQPASQTTTSSRSGSGRSSSAHASPRRSRSRPEPKLDTYKAPPVVSKAVKTELRQIKNNQAQRAAQKPIRVAANLKAPVKVKRKVTLVSQRAARAAVKDNLPRAEAKQAAQKLRLRRQQAAPKPRPAPRREDPKIKGRKERLVAKRLEKAARKSKPKIDLAHIPEMNMSREVAPIVKRMAEKRGIEPSILMAQLENESGFNPLATEQGGSVSNTPSEAQGGGISQFITSTAAAYGVKYGASPKAVRSQLRGQAKYMADLGAADNPAQALGDYYGDGNPQGTYAQNILANASKYAALDKPAGKGKPIPKPLRAKAKATLGKAATKRVIAKVKHPTTASASTKPPPAKELHKWVVLTESKTEQGAEQGVKPKRAYKVTIRNMSPELQAALVRLGKNTGIPVRVNEGYRTTKRAEEFPSGTASQHHQGNAVDVDNNADYTAADLAKAGLNNTAVAGEPWHFQPNETGSSVATISGSGGSTAGAVAQTFQAAASGSQSASTTTSKKGKHKRRKRKHRRPPIRLAGIPAELDPADYAVKPSTERYSDYVKSQRVSVGL